MRISHIILCSFIMLLTACGSTTDLPKPVASDKAFPFETSGNFILGIAQNDASETSTLYAIQKDKEFIFLRTDSSDNILCSNLTGTGACLSKNNKTFSAEETATLLRVATQSVKRVMLRETALKDAEITVSETHPKFTVSDPTKITESLKNYFTDRKEVEADTCATLSKTTEKEFVCYWNGLMPFYQYVETSDIPVQSTRAVFAYKDISSESINLSALAILLQKDMQK